MAERDVNLRARITGEGDTDLFRRWVDDLEQIDDPAKTAAKEVSHLFDELKSGSTEAGAKIQQLEAKMRFADAIKAFRQLETRFNSLMERIDRGGDQVQLDKLQREAEEVGREMVQAGNKAERALREINQGAERARKSVGGLSDSARQLRGILAAAGIGLGANELRQFAGESLDASVQLERYRKQLQAAAQDQEAGNDLFEFAQEQARRLGLDLGVLTQQTATFIASTRNSNLTMQERVNILLRTFEASRVMNLETERLRNTLVAVSQIAGKGTASMEELRRQLGENLPGSLQILQTELGLTDEELFDLVESGKLLSDEALPALARGFEKTFTGDVPAALETTATKLDQLKLQAFEIKAAFGEGLGDGARAASDEAAQSFAQIERSAGVAGDTVGRILVGEIDRLADSIGGLRLLIAFLKDGVGGAAAEFEVMADGVDQTTAATDKLLEAQADGVANVRKEIAELEKTIATLTLFEDDVTLLDRIELESARKRLQDLREELALGERITKAFNDASGRTADLQAESAAAIRGNREEVEKQAAALVKSIRALESFGPLTHEQTEEVKDSIQEVLDALALLGEEAPEDLQRLADKYGVVTSAAEEHARRATRAAEKVLKAEQKVAEERKKALQGVADVFDEVMDRIEDRQGQDPRIGQLRDQLAELERAREEITGGGGLISPMEQGELNEITKQINQVKGELASLGEVEFSWGESARLSAQEADDVISRVIASIGPLFAELDHAGRETVKLILQNLQAAAKQGGATTEVIAEAVRALAEIFESAGEPAGDLREVLSGLGEDSLDVGKALEEMGSQTSDAQDKLEDLRIEADQASQAAARVGASAAQSGDQASEAAVQWEKVDGQWQVTQESAEGAAGAAEEAGQKVEESGGQASEAAVNWEKVDGQWQVTQKSATSAGDAAEKAGAQAKAGGDKAQEGAKGSEAAAAAAEKQATATGKAADALEDVAEKSDQLEEEAAGAAEGLKKIEDQAEPTTTELGKLLEPLQSLHEILALLSQEGLDLSGLRQELQATKTEVDSLTKSWQAMEAAANSATSVADAGAEGGGPEAVN